jgi:4-hydroxy-2-oxoheptanedioate aldolase
MIPSHSSRRIVAISVGVALWALGPLWLRDGTHANSADPSARVSARSSESPGGGSADNGSRLNPLIARLEQGQPALTDRDWMFIDLEHGPYLIDRFEATLAELGKKRDANGRLPMAPIVRIPEDGDEPSRWSVKQVLDAGAFGVIFGHVETKDQALRAIQSMRYPPQRGSKYVEPRGARGYGPGRAIRFWGIPQADYLRRADVWPLNPEGELFAMIMIETAEGVKNINDIVKVPGIGAIFIGASDLGMSLGVGPASPLPPPEAEAAVQQVLKACIASHVTCAYPVLGGDAELKRRLDEGFKVLLVAGGASSGTTRRPAPDSGSTRQ